MLQKQLSKLTTRASAMQVDEDYESSGGGGSRSPRSPAGHGSASFASTMIKGTTTGINQVGAPAVGLPAVQLSQHEAVLLEHRNRLLTNACGFGPHRIIAGCMRVCM